MKIAVINGTEKRGVTYRLKELFLQNFKGSAEITEFCLPKDCPNFCKGCAACCLRGESACKDAEYVGKIERAMTAADLIVITTPAYVMHATGAVKNFLDHMAYRWMPHRPSPEMFKKRAVIISQCLGAGARSAVKDVKDSLSWWGISEIGVFTGALFNGINWENLAKPRRDRLINKITALSDKFARKNYAKPAKTRVFVKIKFLICRSMQRKLFKDNPEYTDAKYWKEQGWLDGERPWKRAKGADICGK